MMLEIKFLNFLIIIWVVSMPDWTSLSTGEYFSTTCTDLGTFRVILDISLDRCIEECQQRKRCLAIMFYQGLNECKLKENMDFIMSSTDQPLCVSVNITDVDWGASDKCRGNDCSETEKCEASSDGFKCVKTECPKPNNVSNAFLLSHIYAVGKKNRYKCNDDFYGVGDPSITCTDKGTWSQTTFKCHPRNYENAEVTAIEGDPWTQGTVIHFKCRPGFQKSGAFATSVMNSQGDWEPSVVPCCHDISTEFLTDRCIALYNGSFVGSSEGMFQYCTNTGGKMKWLNHYNIDVLFERSEYLFLMNNNNKKTIARKYNLTLCLAENMDDDALANYSSFSYDNLVQEVLSKNFTGGSCDSAKFWSPGQPDGGSRENCIAYKRNDPRFYDVSCTVNPGQSIGFFCDYLLPQIHV